MVKKIIDPVEFMYKFFINKKSMNQNNQKNIYQAATYTIKHIISEEHIDSKEPELSLDNLVFSFINIKTLFPPYKYKINDYEFIVGPEKTIALNDKYTKKDVLPVDKQHSEILNLTKKEMEQYLWKI